MNILIVSSLTKTATANYLVNAFIAQGHTIYLCSDAKGTHVDCVVDGAFNVKHVLENLDFKPDVFLFIEGGSMQLFPIGLEELSCITAWYGIDTHTDYAKHLSISRLFDVTFVAQKEFVNILSRDGVKQVFWLPLAFAPILYSSESSERIFDVAYIGSDNVNVHPIRHELLSLIGKKFPNTVNKMASPLEMASIYAQSYIVFNKSVNNDVNMRYFEAMGAGAVLVTDHAINNGVEELFEAGKHFIEYSDNRSLLQVIDELLRNPLLCKAIGDSARQNVLLRHTYEHRVDEFLSKLSNCQSLSKPGVSDYFSVLVKMRMSQAALLVAEKSFIWSSAGSGQKVIAFVVRVSLYISRMIVSFFEFIKKNI